MTEIVYKKLIIKELKGDASPEESQLVDSWINENSGNQNIFNELWSAYQLTSPDINLFIPDKEVAWAKISSKISVPRERGSFIIQLARLTAAAVIFFLIGIAFHITFSDKIPSEFLKQYSKMIVPVGQKSMMVLPDGSSVWLNSGSVLKYGSSFNNQVREVEIEGEAFFEVAKDISRKFSVRTGAVSIEVYGTSFDVKNYKDEKKLEVTVENGNVGIVRDGNKLTDLTKGKQITINTETNQVLMNTANVEVVTAWKNNELVFDGTPFEEVIRYLERWYGVNITIEEKMRKKHNYTFKIKTETLRELLELLKEITPLEYKIDGKNVTIRYSR